ncbi:hypothetical protein HALLA_01805 (plasmid) [Halostagnicola larsenii XH-48]|uniref:IclR family transcriptional regulator n=1 Tax=Halostagnicola larsenii XH-48 TaxID=797299 RepID=W0JYH9_9EURY|nr:IclR family transcriptional regulator [Halostagnicola larsenii]AHG02063.1 hypothetical protein HALLA_01805 [Halostagnicola larsenii XH-48]
MPGPDATNPVSAVETTVSILETITELEGASLTELAERLDVAKSTIHRHLSTLRQEGYVVTDGDEYHVSLHLFDLASYNRERNPLFHIGRSTADEIAGRIEERVSLVVAEQGRAVKCYIAESNRSITTDSHLGLAMRMHCTSGGKALLSQMDDKRVEEILDRNGLERLTDNTITDRESLFEELQEVRKTGIAFDNQERLAGVRGVAAPVVDKQTGDVIGAFDIAGPATRLEGEKYSEQIPNLVQRAADEIAVNIKYWRTE